MGQIGLLPKVRPIAGILAAAPDLLPVVQKELSAQFGAILFATTPEVFTFTEYYTPEMGPGLYRQFLVFDALRDAAELADWKLAANGLEARMGVNGQNGRRVNIDPGYLAPGKLVLASTKDHGHRIYLRDGVFAEITLRIQRGHFGTWEWTYPDYAAQREFFDRAYQEYLQRLHQKP